MENDNLSKIRDLMLARVRGQGGTLGTLLNQWQGKQFNEDRSVMDSYQPPVPQSGYVNTEEPLGPPSMLGGLLSLDPTDYVGPNTLAKLAAGAKGLLSGAALMPMAGMIAKGNFPETIYRGTTGSTERIKGGIGEGLPFAARTEDVAKLYGQNIERIGVQPDANILVEGSKEFQKVTGRRLGKLINNMRQGENLKSAADDVIAKAMEAGYDAVDFNSMRDMGIAILNPSKFNRGQ